MKMDFGRFRRKLSINEAVVFNVLILSVQIEIGWLFTEAFEFGIRRPFWWSFTLQEQRIVKDLSENQFNLHLFFYFDRLLNLT